MMFSYRTPPPQVPLKHASKRVLEKIVAGDSINRFSSVPMIARSITLSNNKGTKIQNSPRKVSTNFKS